MPRSSTSSAFGAWACAAVLSLAGCSKSSAPAPAKDAPLLVPPPPPVAVSPVEEAIAFLQGARDAFTAAEADCYAAERCGSVESPPHRGSVAAVEDMQGCLAMRIPVCAARAEQLANLVPPQALSGTWPDVVRVRAGTPLERARTIAEMIASLKSLPVVNLSKKPLWDADQWALDTKSPFAPRFRALFDEEDRLRSSVRALDDWLQQSGACPAETRCTLGKVMTASQR